MIHKKSIEFCEKWLMEINEMPHYIRVMINTDNLEQYIQELKDEQEKENELVFEFEKDGFKFRLKNGKIFLSKKGINFAWFDYEETFDFFIKSKNNPNQFFSPNGTHN